ncbi:hypothetical protein KAFR_0F00710 [Kazachstania africana CBS 2517]|uniref:ORC6 first cyclin-like domain-containing protein n=1 Tax=Kazachstania africana (strain ATCC 22294 / BCRC 22015 / CBS 2517 / CECT 1963 / NBRC 1671 / NRRL Y-8276) TaxID=1071382 RepID=H2AWB8_KAZAF|nr:hypothetical protein KAFR_0F00710 [Kazachstania africana CBS 2517]CCF58668.1 hypothetical protein KAFR_0F00710 [Kazachstania africana CBS 2517]
MSSKQLQRSILDVLALETNDDQEWTKGYLKKLLSTTSVLYNTSANKVMLKNDEEVARAHICSYIACERLAEKHVPDLQFYMDRIPLEPKKIRNLIQVFKQNLLQMSPVKNLSWTPSPKKQTISPLKGHDSFSSRDPNELRNELFSPLKNKSLSPSKLKTPLPSVQLFERSESESPTKTRRRLVFEKDDDNEEEDASAVVQSSQSPKKTVISESSVDNQADEVLEDEVEPLHAKKRKVVSGSNVSKARGSFLLRKYYKVTPQEVISLCNDFQIPKDVAYNILHEYLSHVNFLVCPWQLVCGLVLNCIFIVFNERRRKDPRIDLWIMQKMAGQMHCGEIEDLTKCVNIVKEFLVGQAWFKELQIKHNFFDGKNYDEIISTKLGSMLQPNNILVSDEQFDNWKQRVEQDLSLRYDKPGN